MLTPSVGSNWHTLGRAQLWIFIFTEADRNVVVTDLVRCKSSNPLPRSSIWNSGRSPKRAEVSVWACNFSIFRHEGSETQSICKGTFHSPGKKYRTSEASTGDFYPSPLTNTLCFVGRCLGKKKKMLFFGGFRFVILLPGFVRMVGDPHRSAWYAISFCNNRQDVFMV